ATWGLGGRRTVGAARASLATLEIAAEEIAHQVARAEHTDETAVDLDDRERTDTPADHLARGLLHRCVGARGMWALGHHLPHREPRGEHALANLPQLDQ